MQKISVVVSVCAGLFLFSSCSKKTSAALESQSGAETQQATENASANSGAKNFQLSKGMPDIDMNHTNVTLNGDTSRIPANAFKKDR